MKNDISGSISAKWLNWIFAILIALLSALNICQYFYFSTIIESYKKIGTLKSELSTSTIDFLTSVIQKKNQSFNTDQIMDLGRNANNWVIWSTIKNYCFDRLNNEEKIEVLTRIKDSNKKYLFPPLHNRQ